MSGLIRKKSVSDPEKLSILPKRKMTNWSGPFRSGSSGSNRAAPSDPINAQQPQGSRRTRRATDETAFYRRDAIQTGSPAPQLEPEIVPAILSASYQSSTVSNDYISGFANSQNIFWMPGDNSNTLPKYLANGTQYGSSQSVVDIDVCDANGDEEVLATHHSIRMCKSLVLKPYKIVQLLVAWRPFRKDKEWYSTGKWRAINLIYPVFIVALILYYDIMQGVTCQGKLNIRTDTKPPPTTPRTVTTLVSAHYGDTNLSNNLDRSRMEIPMCDHLIPTYVIPSLLHLAAFVYGFYHFRVLETEQLYSLMERVFITTRNSYGTHEIIIRNSRRFRYLLFGWLFLHIGLEVLYNFAYDEETFALGRILHDENKGLLYFMLSVKAIGLILVQAVNIAVILNYCTQCEMLIMYIKDINLWLREKTVELKSAMHEILRVREFIGVLNGSMGKMTALCVVNYLEMTIIGFCLLFLNKNDTPLVWSYRSLYILIWLIAFILPLIQASRLSKTGQRLRQVSFEMRVFGYHGASQLELDSFILFVNSATLRAKLYGIAIRPALLLIILGGFFFVLTLLLIGEVLSIGTYRQIF